MWRPGWNWQQADWPAFSFDPARLARSEAAFLRGIGATSGLITHLAAEDREKLVVGLISEEAVTTSEIEGEYLDRDSIRSSLRRNLGLATEGRKVAPAERGVADMMAELFRRPQEALTGEALFQWHALLLEGRNDLREVGIYRTGGDPMQVVSGSIDRPQVHFEAPPATQVAREMDGFLKWFASTAPGGEAEMPALTRAGIAHLYFVSIHPFEDGNGRIGRAICEKVFSQACGGPSLVSLSQIINRRRKEYYQVLEENNRSLRIDDWLDWFARIALEAQEYSLTMARLVIAKARFFDRYRGAFNERQEKVIERMFREEPEGFKGGLSAENYIRITNASRATATRDLQDLVDKEALTRTGVLKGTRYALNLGDGTGSGARLLP